MKGRVKALIFLCFAVADRIPLINNFYQFLQNFGLDIWYDRRNIFFGDDRYKINIHEGAANEQVKYAIVLYSENFAEGNICLEEYKILTERYYAGKLHIFPVFLHNAPETIPEKFSLCKQLVYKVLSCPENSYRIALHVLAKITHDQVKRGTIHTLQDALLNFKNKNSLLYVLLREYDNIEKENYAMRIAGLFNIYTVATYNQKKEYMHFKTINYIYHQACIYGLQEEKRELQIMENIVIYTLGSFL